MALPSALTALAALALAAAPAAGAFDADAYRYVELRDHVAATVKDHPELLTREPGKDTVTFHPTEKLRFAAVATGTRRPLAGFRKDVVSAWTGQNAPGLKDAFREEILVRVAGKEHWMPIQETLVAPLDQEVKAGATVGLYALFIGAANEELLFLVNEFRALDAAAGGAPPARK